MLELRMNEADVQRVERHLQGFADGAPKVLSRALNKGGRRVRRQILQHLAKAMGLPQKLVRVWKETAARRATWRRLTYEIGISAFRPSLGIFEPKQTKGGITRRAGGGRRTIPNAFMIKGKAFTRLSDGRLVPLRGPSPAQVFYDDDDFRKTIQERTAQEVGREIRTQTLRLYKTGR